MNEPAYIKLSISIRQLLHVLKGAPGIAFMSLACNEAEIGLSRGGPLSVYDIAAQTDQSSNNYYYLRTRADVHVSVSWSRAANLRTSSRNSKIDTDILSGIESNL